MRVSGTSMSVSYCAACLSPVQLTPCQFGWRCHRIYPGRKWHERRRTAPSLRRVDDSPFSFLIIKFRCQYNTRVMKILILFMIPPVESSSIVCFYNIFTCKNWSLQFDEFLTNIKAAVKSLCMLGTNHWQLRLVLGRSMDSGSVRTAQFTLGLGEIID